MSSIQIRYEGEVSNYDTNALKAAMLGGLLEEMSEERVNLVNANLVATKRGLNIIEQKESGCKRGAKPTRSIVSNIFF
jgi:D-3-phosphoglycerate dehydrogenase